jgi:hypothetical protein
MTEPTEEEVEAVARVLAGEDPDRTFYFFKSYWLHIARAAILALDEHRRERAMRFALEMHQRFPKTLARLAESERNEVAAEPPAHKDDF